MGGKKWHYFTHLHHLLIPCDMCFFSNKSSQCGVNHGSQEGLCLMNKNGDHQMAVCQNLVPL